MLTLVLLPGLDGTGLLFADLVNALGPEVKTIVVSYPRDVALSYPELETFVRSFLPRDEAFYLLAESFSGPIGIAIAASAPTGLRGLILCCSFARTPLPALSFFKPLLKALPIANLPMPLLRFFLLGRFSTPARLAALAQSLSQVATAVLRARAQAVLGVDACAALSQIKIPILYLRATEDRLVPYSASALINHVAAQTKVIEFIAPHFLLQVLPSKVAAALTDFMGKS